MALPLLTTGNAKLQKGGKAKYLSAGIHLAPHKLSGHNVCPMASKGCALACLNTSGRGVYQKVQNARVKKTKWFFDNRESFMAQLMKDVCAVERKAGREGKKLAIRLNLTSDLQFENIYYQGKTIFEHFPHIQFYDYSKIPSRFFKPLPSNYHLTFSRSESNETHCDLVLAAGGNVAVVFANKLPKTYKGYKVVSGDKNDLRFLDPKNVIVGLSTKGRAKRDESGFVVRA